MSYLVFEQTVIVEKTMLRQQCLLWPKCFLNMWWFIFLMDF